MVVKKLLFIASNATATAHFDSAAELERIQAARELACELAGEPFSLIAHWSVSAHDLRRLLEQHSPDVVHLSSGEVNPAKLGLMLDRGGMVEYISPAALAEIFAFPKKKHPLLVFLNARGSLKHAEAIAPHVGAVVAMRDIIGDSAAIEFLTYFYINLAIGSSVATAFDAGRYPLSDVVPIPIDGPILLSATVDPSNITLAPSVGPLGSFGAAPEAHAKPVNLFCSYSSEDNKFKTELETHLSLLRQQDIIHFWHDRLIGPGSDWKREIDKNLEKADIVLLLISANFIKSQYCYGIEMKRALERQDSGSARVVPILIRECDLEGAPFTSLVWLPTGSKPVKKWRDRDEAWTDVAKGIRRVIETLHDGRSGLDVGYGNQKE